ncbi:hypothetical protein Bca4012_048058 [Brassica carinata]
MASNGSKHCRKTSHRLLRAHVPELLSDTRQQPFIGLELLMISDKTHILQTPHVQFLRDAEEEADEEEVKYMCNVYDELTLLSNVNSLMLPLFNGCFFFRFSFSHLF